jgi:hypothetical protein
MVKRTTSFDYGSPLGFLYSDDPIELTIGNVRAPTAASALDQTSPAHAAFQQALVRAYMSGGSYPGFTFGSLYRPPPRTGLPSALGYMSGLPYLSSLGIGYDDYMSMLMASIMTPRWQNRVFSNWGSPQQQLRQGAQIPMPGLYTPRTGDSLESVSNRLGVPLDTMRALNPQIGDPSASIGDSAKVIIPQALVLADHWGLSNNLLLQNQLPLNVAAYGSWRQAMPNGGAQPSGGAEPSSAPPASSPSVAMGEEETVVAGGNPSGGVDPGWRQRYGENLVPPQFNSGLPPDIAEDACGPIAAVAMARSLGRDPSIMDVVNLAQSTPYNGTTLWQNDRGMAGIDSEKALLDKMGISSTIERAQGGALTSQTVENIKRSVAEGKPVTISTNGHYYVIDGYDPARGFHVGNSGKVFKSGGSDWMSLDQISAKSGAFQGAIFLT